MLVTFFILYIIIFVLTPKVFLRLPAKGKPMTVAFGFIVFVTTV